MTSTNFFVAPHLLTTRKIDLSKEHQMIRMAKKVFDEEEQDREVSFKLIIAGYPDTQWFREEV